MQATKPTNLNGLDKGEINMSYRQMRLGYQLTTDVYNKKAISIKVKMQHFGTVIKPESLYAAECQVLNWKEDIEELEKEEEEY